MTNRSPSVGNGIRYHVVPRQPLVYRITTASQDHCPTRGPLGGNGDRRNTHLPTTIVASRAIGGPVAGKPLSIAGDVVSAGAFSLFAAEEMPGLLANLFGIYAQRGCIQRCAGCHAGALPDVATVSWPLAVAVLTALREASARHGVPVQAAFPNALIETFRDSDPAHLECATGEGIGDFARLVAETTRCRVKIMTAGVRGVLQHGALRLADRDLQQLTNAGLHAGRMSVSISTQTRQYRVLGPERVATVLARTFEACLRGATSDTEVFVDVVYFADRDNPPTRPLRKNENAAMQATLRLLDAVLTQIETSFLSAAEKQALRDFLQSDACDGTTNHRFLLPGRQVGLRVSPYLNIGRAAKDHRQGLAPAATHVSDWLSVLPGDPADTIGLTVGGATHGFTRAALQDPQRRHAFLTVVQAARGDGLLSERAALAGPWLTFFRAELDLSPAVPRFLNPAQLRMAPGVNHGPGVNLLVSDVAGGELQVVIPYQRLTP
ncbi:MAG: hypothetical protein HY696_02550 [Deltaproteobacteria bacterium]|nr:hypothetical protein [Deltaproteobacteria bacterium]